MQRCLDRYALAEPVASGAHGQVWRGEHLASGTPVAVKILRGEPGTHASFETEAAAIARLDHPHILPILDLGRVSEPLHDPVSGEVVPVDAPLLVMPWADGGTLGSEPLAVSRVRGLARQLLEALAHAHARGVLHLDLKPANILLHGGDALLADFSVATLGSQQGRIQGTPRYMAPEQLRGEALSPATDRYALGCVLYELLAGAPPFRDDDTQALARAHLTAPPPALPDSVPPDLAHWISTLLSKSPWARFETDRAATDALGTQHGHGTSTAPLTPTGASETLTMQGLSLDFDPSPSASDAPAPPDPLGITTPELPAELPDWRDFPVPVRGRLDSVGSPSVRLLRLRTLPTVGRVAERDALWDALAATRRAPSLAVIHGPPGAGATHLGRWIQTLAVELGIARRVGIDEGVPADRRGVCWLDDPDRPTLTRVLAAMGDPSRGAVLYVVSTSKPPRGPIAMLGTAVELKPLSAEDHAVLVSQIVGVEPTGLQALYRTSSGLPGPTVERIGRALRSGALIEVGDRWTLDDAALPPAGVHSDALLDPMQRIAMQVAAAFDGAVALDTWRAGCRALGLNQPDRVLPMLEPMVRTAGGTLVVDPDVREALDIPGALQGRLARAGLGTRADRGRWLIAAGENTDGATLLLDAVEHRIRGRSATLHPWLHAAECALRQVPPDHPLRVRLLYLQCRRQTVYGRFEHAERALAELRAMTSVPMALLGSLQADLSRYLGDAAGSLRHVERTLLRDPAPTGIVAIHLHHTGGYCAGALHDAGGVLHHFGSGAEIAARYGYPHWEAGMLTDGAGWLGRLGDERAEALSERALKCAEAHELHELVGFARVNLGESAWERGDLATARELFARAERELAAQGSIVTLSCRLLRLCVALEQGETVRTRLTALRRVFEGFSTASVDLLRCRAAEAVAAAEEGEPERCIERAEEVVQTLAAQPELRLPVLAELLEALATHMVPHRPDLAQRLRQTGD